MSPQQWLDWIASLPEALGYALLGLAAMIEYLFPPFPGDTVTLVGSILIDAASWSAPLVLASVTLGSLVGAMADYEVGAWLAQRQSESWLHRRLRAPPVQEKIDALCLRFARYGSAYIAINRFLPGVRGIFFVVAGMAGLPRLSVALWATLSALLWNGLIVLVGYLIGFNLERLVGLVRQYTQIAWLALLLLAASWGWRAWRRRRAQGQDGGEA